MKNRVGREGATLSSAGFSGSAAAAKPPPQLTRLWCTYTYIYNNIILCRCLCGIINIYIIHVYRVIASLRGNTVYADVLYTIDMCVMCILYIYLNPNAAVCTYYHTFVKTAVCVRKIYKYRSARIRGRSRRWLLYYCIL